MKLRYGGSGRRQALLKRVKCEGIARDEAGAGGVEVAHFVFGRREAALAVRGEYQRAMRLRSPSGGQKIAVINVINGNIVISERPAAKRPKR
jgi:hypothetical protein